MSHYRLRVVLNLMGFETIWLRDSAPPQLVRKPKDARHYLPGLGEDLFEEVLHGLPGAAVGGLLELGTHLGKVGVRHSEGMHGAAVVDDLPVRDAGVS